MVCYARPAGWLAAILVVSWLVFAEPVSHFFDSAALVLAVAAATVGAAMVAALVVGTFMVTRGRRAAAGGCVNCQFRCQHAMSEQTRRPWLVTAADRTPPGSGPGQPGSPGRQGVAPVRSVPILLPMPAVRSATPATAGVSSLAAPHWPDRPAYRSGQVPHRAAERAGAPALARSGAADRRMRAATAAGSSAMGTWPQPGSVSTRVPDGSWPTLRD